VLHVQRFDGLVTPAPRQSRGPPGFVTPSGDIRGHGARVE